jgi:3-methylfumaryl-CoA hydratase
MAELLRAQDPQHRVARFDFRLRRPVFLGDRVRVQGEPADDAVILSVVSGSGVTHATATATYG